VAAATNTDNSTALYVANPQSTKNPVPFTVDDDGYGFTGSVPGNSVVSFRWDNAI
jgi:hypothetical protein